MSNETSSNLFKKARKLCASKEYREASNILWQSLTYYNGSYMAINIFIQRIVFNEDTQITCKVNFNSGTFIINPHFFLKYIIKIEDLIWIFLHERGHIILNLSYKENNLDRKVRGLLQDSYINQNIARLVNSKLLDRFYKDDNPLSIPLKLSTTNLKNLLETLDLSKIYKNEVIKEYKLAKSRLASWPNYARVFRPIIQQLLLLNENKTNEGENNSTNKNDRKDNPTNKKNKENDPTNKRRIKINDVEEIESDRKNKKSENTTKNDKEKEGIDDKKSENTNNGVHISSNNSDNKYSSVLPEIVSHTDNVYQIRKEHEDGLLNIKEISAKINGKIKADNSYTDPSYEKSDILPKDDNIGTKVKAKILGTSLSNVTYGKSPYINSQITNNDLTLISAGHIPPLWDLPLIKPEIVWDLYVDVSVSLEAEWDRIIKIVMTLERFVNRIFQFSGRVVEVDKKGDLNKIVTTRLTNFNAVARSIFETRAKNVIIATDNQGYLTEEHSTRLKTQLSNIIIIKVGAWSSRTLPEKTWLGVTNNCISID